ncbi:aldo-keto reductase [Stachybotrys elegans]|uniref:Aldo-keto reductase n=1 Tax=Stachybotrys elegans TaxID=80388 RepID=A0A8K0WKB7_9HYPO|nr:aldo-keto reductase [Stachybotrys elegans]
MDDVLITNLSPELLRSSLRTLISLGGHNQQAFVQHVRRHITSSPATTPSGKELFPVPNVLSDACIKYLADTRCVFSCKLSLQAVYRLSEFCQAIVAANATWELESSLEKALEGFGGDIVQCVQSLKEAGLVPTDELKEALRDLVKSLSQMRAYCVGSKPQRLTYPLTRGERQVHDIFSFLFPTEASAPDAQPVKERIDVKLPTSSKVETFKLGDLQFPRLFNGFWQLSSPAWGSASADKQEQALKSLVEAGLYAADMADHYGDAELVYGDFRNKLAPKVQSKVYAATKWCVFGPVKVPITEAWVLENVEARYRRLGGCVDLLQFHWYDYEVKDWLFILEQLIRLTKSRPDLVRAIGLCNFDSDYTVEACEYLISTTGSVGIVSNQVQFSLLDSRPLQRMCAVCDKYGLKLLTYGSFSGGLISEKWLGQPAPDLYSESLKLTPSQRKYYDIITTWGTWAEFQELLAALVRVGSKHQVSLTNVASRWVLQQPAVGAVIVGTRLGVSAHEGENLRVFDFSLDEEDIAVINRAALGVDMVKSVAIYQKIGDCGHEYRSMH